MGIPCSKKNTTDRPYCKIHNYEEQDDQDRWQGHDPYIRNTFVDAGTASVESRFQLLPSVELLVMLTLFSVCMRRR